MDKIKVYIKRPRYELIFTVQLSNGFRWNPSIMTIGWTSNVTLDTRALFPPGQVRFEGKKPR